MKIRALLKNIIGISAGCIAAFAVHTTSVGAADIPVVPMSDGSAFIEAENTVLKTYCKITESEDASGGKAIKLGNASLYRSTTPLVRTDKKIDYKFEVDYASRVYVYARVRAEDSSSNEISVTINGVSARGKVNVYGEYTWVQLGELKKGYYVTPGVQTISLVPITDGIEVDEILITRKTGTPKGKDIMDDSLDTGIEYTQSFNENDKGFAKTVLINEQEYDVSEIKPIEGHPRILFTKDDIPRILENAQKPENISAWNVHLEYVEDRSEKPSTEVIEAQALDYALRGNLDAGKNAVKEALEFFADNGQTYAKLTGDTYNQIGQAVVTLSCVYDWCYDLLGEDEKRYLIDEMIMLQSQGNFEELKWPPYTENAFTTHMAEKTLQYDVMLMGIAIYDERSDVYEYAAGRFFNEFVEYRQWIFGSHTFNQGYNYLDYRLKWEMYTTFLIDKGLGIPNIYGDGLRGVMYSRIYTYRPDGFWLPEGDCEQQTWSVVSKGGVVTWLAASYYNDPYLKQAYAEFSDNMQFKKRNSVSYGQISTTQWLLFNNPDLEGKSESELPLSKYYPSPAGNMTARTGWTYGTESPTVVAQMKLDEYTMNGHDHKDSGSFMIYYKGYLARESGTYKIRKDLNYKTDNIGSSEFLSHHHSFFYTRAIAHNCMLVYDPDEEFYGDRNERDGHTTTDPYEVDKLPNDGGQKQNVYDSNFVTDFEYIKNDDHKTAEVLGHEYGEDQIEPNFTYLKGDLSYAYSDKVSEYERSFMFLNHKNDEHPATLIVFDRIKSSDASFKKTWQMYGSNNPQINGSRVVFEDVRSEQDGKWNYNGKLTLDTLMPSHENVAYNVVGGEGQWSMVDGVNYGAKMPDDPNAYRDEYNNYRLEISPKNDSELDYFLNVMQVGDADGADAYDVQLIETDKLAGCVVGDRVVVFGKRRDRTSQATEFEFTGEGEFEVTVADMQAGTWSVYRNGEYIGDYGATADGGVVTFVGTGGSYRLVYKNTTAKTYAEPTLESKSRVSLYYDGVPGYAPEKPYINDDGILMIPARSLFEKVGAEVGYDDATGSVIIKSKTAELAVKDGSSTAIKTLGDITYRVQMSSQATMKNGTMMVPADLIPFVSGNVSYTFAELSQRLDVKCSTEGETEYTVLGGFNKEVTDGETIYRFDNPVYARELFVKAKSSGQCRAAYSLDGTTWIDLDTELDVDNESYVSLTADVWCNFIKLYDCTAEVDDIRILGEEYINDVYDRIFDVEWSAQNNSSETGLQAIDGNVNTLWSAEGMGQYLIFDLGSVSRREATEIVWNKGNERQAYFDVLGSNDKENWSYIIKDGVSSGKSTDYELYEFDGTPKYRYIKVEMFGTSTGTWNAIKEIRFIKDLTALGGKYSEK